MNEAIRHKDVWSFTHAGLPCEVCHHSKGEMINDGHGIWCYYVFIPERRCSATMFETLWLPDQRIRWFPAFPERITHDYDCLFSACAWHGGLTYYEKHGHSEGHRAVQLGCDWSHLWDCERGGVFTLEEVAAECRRTAELIAAEIKLVEATV